MSTPIHRIKRQVFEIKVADRAVATAIHNRISSLQRRRIQSELSQVLDRIDPQQGIVRIDTVTVDLGAIRVDQLDTQMSNALRRELPNAIREAIAAQRSTASPPRDDEQPDASGLSLVEQFLVSGTVSWWVDQREPGLIARQVSRLRETQRSALTTLLRRRLVESIAARRLAQALPLRILHRIVEDLAAGLGPGVRAVATGLIAAMPVARRRRLRGALWAAILQSVTEGAQAPRSFWRTVIRRLANLNGLTMREQLQEFDANGILAGAAKTSDPSNSADRILGELWAELGDAKIDTARNQVSELQAQMPLMARVWGLLADAIRQRPAAIEELAPAIAALRRAVTGGRADESARALTGLLALTVRLNLVPASVLASELRRVSPDVPGIGPDAVLALATQLEGSQSADTASRDPTRAGYEEGLTVINAGLVILWPFLTRFFERLNLLDGESFADSAARDRAIDLLHFAASGDTDPQEYQLALNKIICGADPAEPWTRDNAPSPEALEECAGLLDACLAQAPMLGAISRDGLRGSFLLRQGVLYPEMGHWLLRVERESFDIVLDRLPWSFGWVRLPWMTAPLQVDW